MSLKHIFFNFNHIIVRLIVSLWDVLGKKNARQIIGSTFIVIANEHKVFLTSSIPGLHFPANDVPHQGPPRLHSVLQRGAGNEPAVQAGLSRGTIFAVLYGVRQ